MKKIHISAVIIAKDEEKMIEDCLKSLSWADEVLVIDTGSIDNTSKIAKKRQANVIRYTEGSNFSDWRNKGMQEAAGEWILYIDADERVSPALAKEIQVVTGNYIHKGYAIPRKNVILGREMTHGGWWPDYVKRLFLKEGLEGWFGELHEEPVYEGEMGHLKNPLVHIKHETLPEMVEKTNNWSQIEARLMYEAGHPPMNVARFISAMGREFWYRMIRKMAFLDGAEGMIMAMYQVFSKFTSYAKLWEMQEKDKLNRDKERSELS